MAIQANYTHVHAHTHTHTHTLSLTQPQPQTQFYTPQPPYPNRLFPTLTILTNSFSKKRACPRAHVSYSLCTLRMDVSNIIHKLPFSKGACRISYIEGIVWDMIHEVGHFRSHQNFLSI